MGRAMGRVTGRAVSRVILVEPRAEPVAESSAEPLTDWAERLRMPCSTRLLRLAAAQGSARAAEMFAERLAHLGAGQAAGPVTDGAEPLAVPELQLRVLLCRLLLFMLLLLVMLILKYSLVMLLGVL